MKIKMMFALGLALALSVLLMATTASAALPTGLSWVKYASNPVVNSTLCYSGEHFRPALVVEGPGSYKMYFSNRSDGAQVYLAMSGDGGQTWSCANGGAPVLPTGGSGAWDEKRVMTVSVVKDGASDYKMWYTGRSAAAVYAIGYATSSDGVSWTKYGSNPVLTKGTGYAWDSQYVREPSVLNVGGTYHMWYSGTAKWPYFHIGHATSSDGIHWTKDAGNPVIPTTTGNWDQNEQYAPSVVANGGAFEMFYSGNTGGRWVTGHATASSANGPWTTETSPIISPDASGWEAGFDSTDYAAGVLDGSTWKVFYSAGGSYQIGLATLQNTAQLSFSSLATSTAVGGTNVVTINLTSVTGLYGYQFEVHFDSTKLSASGAFVNSFFDTTTNAFIVWNRDCSTPGVCKFAVTKQNPAPPISGSGPLAQITFTGAASGLSTVTFVGDILADKNGGSITHTTNTGSVTVFNAVTVNGTVAMQGRSSPGDPTGTITIFDENGYAPPVTTNFNSSGAWSTSVAVDSESTTFDIQAAHSVYLTNQLTGANLSGNYTAAPTTLKGGDATNDGTVDIGDLSCIGGAFGGGPTPCGGTGSSDINGDGKVNILDLVLAGGNYGLSSPQPW